jgi:hypothetical protein
MQKNPLIGVSICAVVLLVLASLSNVVGYQSVKSTVVYNSPLFKTRTQRATNQQQHIITSQYFGKGKYSMPFPLRDNRTVSIQKFISRVRTMDDITFKRFIVYVFHLLSQQEKTKDVDFKDIVSGLNQIKSNSEMFQISNEYTINNQLCSIGHAWIPGCIIVPLLYVLFIIFARIITFTAFCTITSPCEPLLKLNNL